MIVKCPDGMLINMDQVITVHSARDTVVFGLSDTDTMYLSCEDEEHAREIVDRIFRSRQSRLDLTDN